MWLYVDESIHQDHGFMILAYVLCDEDPQDELTAILLKYHTTEFHSSVRMRDNHTMQSIRAEFLTFLGTRAKWGVIVAPSLSRYATQKDIAMLLDRMLAIYGSPIEVFIDEGILSLAERESLSAESGIENVNISSSSQVKGIQLADLVAALNGIRVRDAISGKSKMLLHGDDRGYDPPIEVELGFELWAHLRYSMMRESNPLGCDSSDVDSFRTNGYGLMISASCTPLLAQIADELLGTLYLGCIH